MVHSTTSTEAHLKAMENGCSAFGIVQSDVRMEASYHSPPHICPALDAAGALAPQ